MSRGLDVDKADRDARAHTALLIATLACGCATGTSHPGAQVDAQPSPADAPQADARDIADAPAVTGTDAGCGISEGMTPALDGTDDLAAYPASQRVTLGAMLGSDAAAVAWDRANLYVTVSSAAFTNAYEPLHIYIEAMSDAMAAQPAMGKEYGGLVPALPFSPTHLIAIRRVSDSGSGAYDGVFVPGDGWMTRTFALDTRTFVSADQQTLSVSVPWTALSGCPTKLRLALHVVHAVTANEWKDLVPSTHTPWQSPGGGYYELDLTAAPAVTNWSLR